MSRNTEFIHSDRYYSISCIVILSENGLTTNPMFREVIQTYVERYKLKVKPNGDELSIGLYRKGSSKE